jgi:hypothetical protein
VIIQLTRRGARLDASDQEIAHLCEQYRTKHYLLLSNVIEPGLLGVLLERIERAEFAFRETDGVLTEFRMVDRGPGESLSFLVSNPAFLRFIEQITGSRHLGQFVGRVYRMSAAKNHYSEWHNDVVGNRRVAMSINLTRTVFGGGALQMRKRNSDTLLAEVKNSGLGDALLFRVSTELLHRVQGIEGDVPRTAFAGWFLEGEDWLIPVRSDAGI